MLALREMRLQSVAVDAQGRVHAADSQLGIVQVLHPVTGAYLGHYGGMGTGDQQLNLPLDIAITADARVLVADNQNHRVASLTNVP